MSFMTTTDLINEVKQRTFLPASQGTFSDSQILDFANLEMRDKVFRFVMDVHEEYYIETTSTVLDGNFTKIRVPERAINQTIRDLTYVDNSGNLFELPLIQMNDDENWQYASNSAPSAYYIIGSYIQLVPEDGTFNTGSIRIRYPFRPNKLVSTSRAALITSVGANSVTVATVPSNIMVGSNADIVTTRSGYETTQFDLSVSTIVGGTVTFSSVITNVHVGDYLCLAEESPIVQLPENCRLFMIERVAYRIFASWGKIDQANQSLLIQQDMLNDLTKGLTNRATEPVKLIRRHSMLRQIASFRRGNPTTRN